MRNSREVNSNNGRFKCSSYPSLYTDEGSPNNPSSSSHFLHLTKSSDELGQSHLSTFSIRDYAFSNRTKNIQKSWPFSSTSLQICLKHGLSDPLPPIQPLGPMTSHPPEASSSKKPTKTQVEAISCKRKFKRLASNDHATADTKQGFESGLKSKTQVTMLNKAPKKKCGLVVKPGACVDSASKEDQSSESMALRTCPICKTFSSASNTTLNAHIDQCLSVDSGEQPVSKPNKHRAKPRLKVKTMVDIYASAKGCTLEELDKRNGTKWAVISSYSNQVVSDSHKPEAPNKGKKRSVLRVQVDEEDAAGIGPVYIDAKGQKLRIISEVKEKASGPSREHDNINEKETLSEGKGSYRSCKKKLGGNASEIYEYSEECRGMERSETPVPSQRRSVNQRMLRKHSLSRNEDKKVRSMYDQPSENGHVSHVSTDLSEAVNSQSSWRSCEDSQVSGKSTKSATFVDKGVMKLKKAWRFDVSENEDEDSGRWESEMTQERELADYDDWDEDKVSSPSTSGGEDDDYDSLEETGNNEKGDGDKFDKTNDADAEFESMVYETTGFETEEPGSSFMEVDPIPIPGPPGSFLESPWDMGAADATEHHGNFTSHVKTSYDQLDFTDRNVSESPVSAVSNFAAPETQTFSLHNIITTDKRPAGFRDNDQSCCCQGKENGVEDRQPASHMIHQDLLSKSVPMLPSNSGPVLRLMGKDLMVVNQREETSHGDSSLKPASQFQDLSMTQQVSPHAHLHPPYGGNGLYFDSTTSFYNIP